MALDRVIFGRFLVNGGAAYAADPRLTISSDFTGPRDTMSFREYGFVGSTTGWQPPVPYAPNIGSTIGHTLVGGAQDGSKSLDCTFADALGGTVAWIEKLFLDTTSPTVSALRSPTHPDEATWYTGRDPSFTWTGSDPRQNGNYAECASGVAGYSYVLDGFPATDPDTSVDGTGPAAAFSGLADGVWYVHVRAVDKAGNLSATSHWAVRLRSVRDLAAPVTTATGFDTRWHNHNVSISLAASDIGSGVATTEYAIDNGTWVLGASLVIGAPATHADDGVHTVAYRSTDKAGTIETAKTCTVRIDTRGPVTAGKAASGRKGHAIALRNKISDGLSPKATAIRVVVKNRHGTTVKTFRPTTRATAIWYSVEWTPKARGTFRYYVNAKHLAGNPQRINGKAKAVVR